MDAKSDGTDIHSDFSQRVARMWFGPARCAKERNNGRSAPRRKSIHQPVPLLTTRINILEHRFHRLERAERVLGPRHGSPLKRLSVYRHDSRYVSDVFDGRVRFFDVGQLNDPVHVPGTWCKEDLRDQ